MRGERGAAARAVGDDLVALVEAVLVPELAQRPPDRLDVVVLEGDVGVVEVDPEADPLGQPVPLLDVLEDRLAAALVELGDPELLDLLLGGDPELLFDLELDRQAVAVPAGLARHPVAAHRLVARVDVLEDAGEDVVGAGAAVGGRRALVEAPDLGALAVGERALEDVALAPAREHPLLQLGEGLLGVDWAEAGHEQVILGAGSAAAPHARSTTSTEGGAGHRRRARDRLRDRAPAAPARRLGRGPRPRRRARRARRPSGSASGRSGSAPTSPTRAR